MEISVWFINFFDEVILGNTNPETIKKKGWELNFFEIFYLRGGRFEEDYSRGNWRFNTLGYGVRLGGIVKYLRFIDVPLPTDKIFGFILHHVDIRYNHSKLIPDESDHPLSDTRFNSINILISN